MKAESKTKHPSVSHEVKLESAAPPPSPSPTALTRVDPEWNGLPPRQRTALMALAAGRGYTEAARAAGVSRQTLHAWRNKDPRFAAVFNSWHNQAIASAKHRLIALADDAITTLGDAIHTGDVRATLELLRRLGLLVPAEVGPDDPAQLQEQTLLAQRERLSKIAGREALLRADKALAKMLP
jgi:hypothetical protein